LRSRNDLLCDPQTSGGFLIAAPRERADALADALTRRGVLAARIDEISDGPPGSIRVQA
jgi:selenophosphate synthase